MENTHTEPKGIYASKKSVESFAEKTAKDLGFNAGDSIEKFVDRIGGKLVVGSSGKGDKESGSVIAHSLTNWTIYVSRHTSLKRDRFTIAHEIGHLLLHLGPIQQDDPTAVMRATRSVDMSDAEQKRAEWEANWFAAGFLMPTSEFKEIYSARSEAEVSRHFGVSLQAAKIRAESLGL